MYIHENRPNRRIEKKPWLAKITPKRERDHRSQERLAVEVSRRFGSLPRRPIITRERQSLRPRWTERRNNGDVRGLPFSLSLSFICAYGAARSPVSQSRAVAARTGMRGERRASLAEPRWCVRGASAMCVVRSTLCSSVGIVRKLRQNYSKRKDGDFSIGELWISFSKLW